jgi:hypothetical protein
MIQGIPLAKSKMSEMARLIREAEIARRLVFRNRLALAGDSVRETGFRRIVDHQGVIARWFKPKEQVGHYGLPETATTSGSIRE